MDALLTAAAAGLRTRAESLDMLANNLANAATAGFKADREVFAEHLGAATAGLPDLVANWVDLSQGALAATANPLDVAIEGPGFLAVRAGEERVLTRGGSLRAGAGGVLETAEGWPVEDESGRPIRLDPARPVAVEPDGTVRQGGEIAGRIALWEAPREALERRANTSFRVREPARLARTAGALRAGYLEGANVSVPDAAVRLVTVLRHFEMLERALGVGAEMNRRATEEVAKVGP
jgi:flagellar basal body rod protein FlgG